jgi:inosose dehydratase
MIRVANAPCSWGILEFDRPSTPLGTGVTPAASYTQVLDEIHQTGYAGTELGDWGFMPTDPGRLREEMARRNLRLIGGFVPVPLADVHKHAEGIATAVRTARLLRDAGGGDAVIVLSDDNGSVAEREQCAGRITPEQSLTDEQWATFADGAERVARAVRDETGLRTVFHEHCGGYVETEAEIDALMARTDPALLGLCLDTGHIVYGGGDPLHVLERHARRVWHVHFKDCDPAVASAARTGNLGYLSAVRSRLFCELGAGGVDFRQVVAALQRHGYDGWIVVEQDVFPGYGTPADSARRSREYLKTLGLA